MKVNILNRLKVLLKKIAKANERGAALVITLMVMLTLVLISLSLVMQSNTEHLISQNEQDSFHALADAEGIVDLANRDIKSWVQFNRPVDLDPILQGSMNPSGADFMVGFRNVLNTGLGRNGLTDANEEFTSAVGFLSGFGTDPEDNWEIFRTGVDENGDGRYDGNVRTLVYARLRDNFDDVSTVNYTDDTDLRMRLEVRTIYPVFVDLSNNGIETSAIGTRGRAERHLVARFGPSGSKAIRTDGDIEIWGSLDVCGECGSAHANGTMEWGHLGDSLEICGDATGSAGFLNLGGTITGDKGLAGEIYIPIINPYDKAYVPPTHVFNRSAETTTLPSYLQCAGPSETDPGNSKYYSVVKMSGRTQIYKAYRNYGDAGADKDTKWVWRLIGDSSVNNLDTVRLDDCGRVKACPGIPGCSADQKFVSGSWVANADPEVPTQNNTFYGLNPDNNFSTGSCSSVEGETIDDDPYTDEFGVAQNDWNRNDFWQVQGSTQSVQATNTLSHTHSVFCPSCPYTAPPLPGGLGRTSGITGVEVDGNGDFDTSYYVSNGEITDSGNATFSPLYNAVIFIRGNLVMGGNISNLTYSGGTVPLDGGTFDFNQTWRVTWIVFGQADIGGSVNYAPPTQNDPTTDFRFAVIAGRDIQLHGSTNTFDCNETDCDASLAGGGNFGYAGAYACHEQILINGSVGLNGYIVAEDRASCDDSSSMSSNDIHGSLDVHYDCTNPTDFWAAQSVRIREWEESQRVQ